jgi:tetratricopeptide (TPR) repeat protein
VQDTAYDSLLKSQRQPLHGRIAEVLEARWPETRDTEPELLAHHYTAAGVGDTAVRYWRRAGEVAMKRFAVPEAVTHLRKGMALVETLPGGPERNLMELGLRSTLGPAVVAQRGWGHGDVSSILEPAWKLAESLQHRESYLPILSALWVHYLCLDRLHVALQWAQKLLAAGIAVRDDSLEIVGHRALSASYYWLGDFLSARKHGDIVRSMYDAGRHFHVAQLTNTDPLTGEGIYRAQYLWMLGFPDQAIAATNANHAHARRRYHPFDLAFALTLGAQAFDFLSEPEKLLEVTEEAERVGRKHGVALLWEVMAEISLGVAWLRQGRARDSVVQLDKAIARLTATGHRIWIWYLRALQAEGLAQTGELARAVSLVEESVVNIERGEERVHYAEVLRLRGWLLMQAGRIDQAESSLRQALEVARAQQAKSWELRAATTLAHLLASRGDSRCAYELLADVYNWFSEGLHTKDLTEARTLLDALERAPSRASAAG